MEKVSLGREETDEAREGGEPQNTRVSMYLITPWAMAGSPACRLIPEKGRGATNEVIATPMEMIMGG
jgi:hypothetical protein